MAQTIGTVLIDIKGDTSKLVDGMAKAEASVNKAVGNMKNIILSLGSAYISLGTASKALEAGFSFNKNLEQAVNGLNALSVATSTNTSSTGQHLSMIDKYNLAQKENLETVKKLQVINAETPHTLNQTISIYKAMYPSMKAAGASVQDMIEVTKGLSIASGSAGIQFDQLLAGVDGLANGTVDANSELGRFLKSLGVTNEKLKSTDDVVKLLKDSFSQFQAADTMEVAVSNLTNSWDMLTGKVTEDAFDGAKKGINELSKLINSMSEDDIYHLRLSVNAFGQALLNIAYYGSVGIINLTNGFESLGARIAGITYRIQHGGFLDDNQNKALDDMYAKTKANIKAREDFVVVLKKAKDATDAMLENTNKKIINNSDNGSLVNKPKDHSLTKEQIAQAKALADQNEKILSTYIGIIGSDYDKWLLKTNQTMKELSATGYLTAAQLKEVRSKLEEDFNIDKNNKIAEAEKALEDYSKKVQDENEKVMESFTNITGTDYDKWLINANKKMVELADSGIISGEQLGQAWKAMEDQFNTQQNQPLMNTYAQAIAAMEDPIDSVTKKWMEMYDAIVKVTGAEPPEKFFVAMNKALEDVSKKINFLDFNSQFDPSGLNQVGKALYSIKGITASIGVEQKAYNKAKDDSKGNSIDIAKIEDKHFENQLDQWSNIAGAMSGAFKDGSDAAKIFQGIQLAIATVSAGQALITAWADPTIPAVVKAGYVATVAANVYSLLSMIGGGGGGGGGVDQLDTLNDSYTSSMDAATADLELQYEPLLKKFDTQIGLLEQIEKNGSASRYSISQAKTQYEFDTSTYANQISDVVGGVREVDYSKNNYSGMLNTAAAFQGLQNELTNFGIDASGLYTGIQEAHKTVYYNNVAALNTYSDLLTYVVNREKIEAERDRYLNGIEVEVGNATDKFMTDAQFEKVKIDMESFISEFALVVGDSLDSLKDMSMTFQDAYDAITDTTTYSTKRLMEAYDDVNNLLTNSGNTSLLTYMQNQIQGISDLEIAYGEKVSTLLSDSYDVATKSAVVLELENLIGAVFDNGAEDALNYLDSIDLVSKAMEKSNKNIKDYQDSFKTQDQLVEEQANSLHVGISKTYDALNTMFISLSTDIDGLTDSELDFLNANKALIDANDAVTKSLNDFVDSIFASQLTSALGLTYSMSILNNAINSFATSTDKSASASNIVTAANNAITYQGNTATSAQDYQYQVAVIANQVRDLAMQNETGSFKTVEEAVREQTIAIVKELQEIKNNTEVDRVVAI